MAAFKRIAGRVVVNGIALLLASVVIFALVKAAPGDPAQIMLGTSAAPDTLAALRVQLGLDQPLIWQYLGWLQGIVSGDMGQSYTYDVPVSGLVASRAAVTLPLAALASTGAVMLAVPLGVWAAARPGGGADIAATVLAQMGIAVPNFWIAIVLILTVSLGLGYFPAGGFPGWQSGWVSALQALILPAISLGIPQAAVLTRVTRAAVLDLMHEDFIRTARAKGLSLRQALWRHAVPNALLPVVTMLGLQIPFLISGAVLVENVFNLPGIGTLAYQALAQRDLIVVQNVILLFAALVLVMNVLTDTLAVMLDPRLRGRG
ncbi:ABC transporter permease [Rhodobacteraceae bacterium]|nr:ABC transporter permease [Paracoccaceae bacterium]